MNFSKRYPHITWWIDNQGWIEIGANDENDSLIRLLDEGGVWWEDTDGSTLDDALENTETFLIEDLPQRFGRKFRLEK